MKMKSIACFLTIWLVATTTADAATIAAKLIKQNTYSSILFRLSDEKYPMKCDGVSDSRFGVIQVVSNHTLQPIQTFKACYFSEDSENLYILYWDETNGEGSSVSMSKKSFDKTPYFKNWGPLPK